MATIRMSKVRKNELKIMKAVRGKSYVIKAICDAFSEAHKDVKHEPDTKYSYGNYIIDVADGLVASTIYGGAFNVNKRYVYIQTSEAMRYKIGRQYTTSSVTNPVISQADEPVRYKYECNDYVVDGLKGWLAKALTDLTTMDKFNHSVSHDTLTTIENMIAWIELEGQLPTGFQIASKRKYPRFDSEFVVRSKPQRKNSDYSRTTAIGIEYTNELRETVKLMKSALDALSAFNKAATNLSSITSNGHYAERDLASYKSSLDKYKADLESLKVKADGDLDAAIKKDDADRLEINEYLSNVPNSHLLLDGSRGLSVNWSEQTLAYRVKGLQGQIENYTRYVKQKKLAIQRAKSTVPVLDYELNFQKLKEFAMLHDLLVQDGEEE